MGLLGTGAATSSDSWIGALRTSGLALGGVVVVVAVALVIAALAPEIVRLFDELVTRLHVARHKVGRWAHEVLGGRLGRFWRERASEPLEPLLVALRRVTVAAETLGDTQVAALHVFEAKLARHLEGLRAAASPGEIDGLADRERVVRAVASGGLGRVLLLVLFAVLLGGTNATLLALFFREFLGTRALLPAWFPNFQVGHAIAIVIALFEVVAGWLIHHYSHLPPDDLTPEAGRATRAREGPEQAMYGFAWFLVSALAVLEFVAYGILSRKIGAAELLGVPATSALHGALELFLGLMGIAMALGLVGVGFTIEAAVHATRRARAAKQFLKALARRDETVRATVDHVRTSVAEIRDAAREIPDHVAADFRSQLRLDDAFPSGPLTLYAGTVRVLTTTDPDAARELAVPSADPALASLGTRAESMIAPRIVRRREEVLGDLLVSLLIAGVLVMAALATLFQVVAWMSRSNLPLALAWAVGLALPAGMALLGLAARSALDRPRYTSLADQMMRESSGIRRLGWVAAVMAGVSVIVAAVLAGGLELLPGHPIVSAFVGATLASFLVVLGGFADRAAVGSAHIGLLGALCAAWTAAALVQAGVFIAALALTFVAYIVRFLAIPGSLLVGWWTRRRAARAARQAQAALTETGPRSLRSDVPSGLTAREEIRTESVSNRAPAVTDAGVVS